MYGANSEADRVSAAGTLHPQESNAMGSWLESQEGSVGRSAILSSAAVLDAGSRTPGALPTYPGHLVSSPIALQAMTEPTLSSESLSELHISGREPRVLPGMASRRQRSDSVRSPEDQSQKPGNPAEARF